MAGKSGNTVIEGLGVHHVAIQTCDWDASIRLYRDIMGMQPVATFGPPDQPIMLLDTGDGSHVELFAPKPGAEAEELCTDSTPMIHLAFEVKDTRSAVDRIRKAGYEITTEPNTVELDGKPVTYAFFKGPNGEILELFQSGE